MGDKQRGTLLHVILVVLMMVLSVIKAQPPCDHPLYCTGPILDAVQHCSLFSDDKTYVDMPTIYPYQEVVDAFNKLDSKNCSVISQFLEKYFYEAGTDVVVHVPSDWNPLPPFLHKINSTDLRDFATGVNGKWFDLMRVWNTSVCDTCHSHIPVPYPFVIAGSRFREYYYWDTYWTIEGLIVSNMLNTTRGVILNFLYLVETYGFVPNGGRIYYLNRSQPPLLIQMVRLYFEATGDVDFLVKALPTLEKEYNYWMANHSVNLPDGTTLNRYHVYNSAPRPESYMQDVNLSLTVPSDYVATLFEQIATGAETGWDFSTRWMKEPPNLATLQTSDIIPVDLNTILYMNEVTMGFLYQTINETQKGVIYQERAKDRAAAIMTHLWNEDTLSWNDFVFTNDSFVSSFYASEVVPLWGGLFQFLQPGVLEKILERYTDMFIYPYGVPTSDINSGQQWDFPNGWAPIQYFVVEGMDNIATSSIASPYARELALNISSQLIDNWIHTNYCGFYINNATMMFEKYDVDCLGVPGKGGEYVVQDGFGWTNGVALHLLSKYGNSISFDENCIPQNCTV